MFLTCRSDKQFKFPRDVPDGGVKNGAHRTTRAGQGIEDGGDDEGEDAGEDQPDVEGGVWGRRDISASHLTALCLKNG